MFMLDISVIKMFIVFSCISSFHLLKRFLYCPSLKVSLSARCSFLHSTEFSFLCFSSPPETTAWHQAHFNPLPFLQAALNPAEACLLSPNTLSTLRIALLPKGGKPWYLFERNVNKFICLPPFSFHTTNAMNLEKPVLLIILKRKRRFSPYNFF